MITITRACHDCCTIVTVGINSDLLPAWTYCPWCCDDFWCNIHQMHVYDCECPPIDEWDRDPYSSAGPGDPLSSVVICT